MKTFKQYLEKSNLSYADFIYAINDGDLELVKFFVEEKGLDVNYQNSLPLRHAINSNWKIVKYLIYKGADISVNNYSISYEACLRGDLKVLKKVCEGDIKKINERCMEIAIKKNHFNIVEYLIEIGHKINEDYLIWASEQEDHKIFNFLFEKYDFKKFLKFLYEIPGFYGKWTGLENLLKLVIPKVDVGYIVSNYPEWIKYIKDPKFSNVKLLGKFS